MKNKKKSLPISKYERENKKNQSLDFTSPDSDSDKTSRDDDADETVKRDKSSKLGIDPDSTGIDTKADKTKKGESPKPPKD